MFADRSLRPFVVVTGMVLLPINSRTAGVPPPPAQRLPGPTLGQLESYWLAPYVRVTTDRLGERSTTSVRWFDATGRVVREVSGPGVDARQGYVDEVAGGVTTIHAVNGNWKFVLPRKADSFTSATPDSRTVIRTFQTMDGKTAVDVYVLGKLVGTIGPFAQYEEHRVQLGADGSFAFLARQEKRRIPQIVAVGPDGRIRFQVDCEGAFGSPIAAPGGNGVLVESGAGKPGQDTFAFYTKAGKVSSLQVGPNPIFVGWIPGSSKCLFWTHGFRDMQYHLIDWDAGKKLWSLPNPSVRRAIRETEQEIAVGKDYVLFGGLELMKVGDWEVPVPSIYAVKTPRGEVVARWLPSPLPAFPVDCGRFMKLAGKLSLVYEKEFTEINLGDIAANRNGWRPYQLPPVAFDIRR